MWNYIIAIIFLCIYIGYFARMVKGIDKDEETSNFKYAFFMTAMFFVGIPMMFMDIGKALAMHTEETS